MKKISVIVPVYNTEKYLSRCLRSIVNQSYSNLELIIINDGSTDNSSIIIDKFLQAYSNIILSLSQNNAGQSAARNLGLKYVTGDLITFVDSDDWLEPNALEVLSQTLHISDSDIAVCNIKLHKHNSIEVSDFLSVFVSNKFMAQKFVWGKLYKTTFWQQHDFKFIENIFYEDLELVPKLLFVTEKIAIVDADLYNYELRNQTSTTKIKKRNDYIYFIFEQFMEFYQNKAKNILFERFLLYTLLLLFLEDYNGDNKVKIEKLFAKYSRIIKLSNCINNSQKAIVFAIIKLKMPLSMISLIVNVRKIIKKSWNMV